MKAMNFESPKWGRSALEVEVVDDAARARRRRRIIIAIAAAAIVLLVVLFLAMGGKKPAAGRGAGPAFAAAQAAPRVTVIVPGRQQIARVLNATGTIAAKRDMPVGISGEGGEVSRVLVEPGQWVRAGQVLAVIERSVQSQQAAQLAAAIDVAKADAQLAQNELDRAQALVGRGFISKADVDRKLATRDQANAQVRVAEAQYRESLARTGRLDIRAPAAGLVLTRTVEPGQVVGAGTGTLFRLAKGGEMELRAQLSETDLAAVHVGATATVTPVGSSQSFNGQVWQVSPVIDPQTRQGIARVALSYSPALRPGGFAQAEIVTGEVNAPVLPESAVLSDQNGNYVYIVDADNKAQRRSVKTGQVSEKGIAIVSGLTGNEKVVLSAGAFLNPGQVVKPHHIVRGR